MKEDNQDLQPYSKDYTADNHSKGSYQSLLKMHRLCDAMLYLLMTLEPNKRADHNQLMSTS